MPKGYMYILKCCDGSYYTGSTKYLQLRISQHEAGSGARYTANKLPVQLVYHEEYRHIWQAFYREKQVQKWSRKKKIALIKGDIKKLKFSAECQNESHWMGPSATLGNPPGN